MMFEGSDWHGLFGGGFMWILWIVLIVVVVYIVKDLGRSNIRSDSSSKQDTEETALEIIRRRYAEGEIDEAEFERRKKELQK